MLVPALTVIPDGRKSHGTQTAPHPSFQTLERAQGRFSTCSDIFEQLGDTVEQARYFIELAWSFRYDKQLDAAKEVASRALNLLPQEGEQFQVCRCHHAFGRIYSSEGDTDKAIHHLGIALGIATSSNWLNSLYAIRFSMAREFLDEGRFDDAYAHIEHAKLHAANDNDTYLLTCAMWLQADCWHTQHRFQEAKSEPLRAVNVFQKLGALDDAEGVRELLRQIDRDAQEMEDLIIP